MRIAFAVLGSRGDVQPLVALGRVLRERGHDVTIAAHHDLEWVVDEGGLDFAALPGSANEFMAHPAFAEALRNGASAIRAVRAVPPPGPEVVRAFTAAVAEVARRSELLVLNVHAVASHDDDGTRPWAGIAASPLPATSRWPATLAPRVSLGPLTPYYNRLTHQLFDLVTGLMVRAPRRTAGLPPLPAVRPNAPLGRDVPVLHPVTRALFTEPDDWPAHAHITGYWFFDRDWTPPPTLTEFLDAGEPPITVSFGSIWPIHGPARTAQKVIAAARTHGRRVVLVGGGDAVPSRDVGDDVHRVADVSYPWLLARSAAFVHHAGTNTVAEGLRAGVPQVTVPAWADSPFWGARAHEIGVATAPVPYRGSTQDRLIDALGRALHDPALRRRAEEVGALVRSEDGCTRAADVLEDWVRRWAGTRADLESTES